MNDLIERLRSMRPDFIKESGEIMQEAADEIERLKTALARSCEDARNELYDCGMNAEIEWLESRLRDRQNALDHAIDYGHRKDAEIERLRDALRTVYTWNASGDYQRDLFRMKDFAIAALEDKK